MSLVYICWTVVSLTIVWRVDVLLPLNVAIQWVYDSFRQYVLVDGCRVPEWMNGFIGIKTNWYTKVKKTLTCVQAIRLHHVQN